MRLTVLRDLLKQIFHGSILAELLDHHHKLIMLLLLIKDISESFNAAAYFVKL